MTTVLQRVDLFDRVALEPGDSLEVQGFPGDTLVRDALGELAREAGVEPAWHVRITKRILVAAGLGGGSSDAATALRLANETLAAPVAPERLAKIAAGLGADVPFFLANGPQLGTGGGRAVAPRPAADYYIVLLPRSVSKVSTASAYSAFDVRNGAEGFRSRRAAVKRALGAVYRAPDLAALPPNDLAESPLAAELLELGAFRADVTGAGPAVYGLFMRRDEAEVARRALASIGRTWLTVPAWYG